MTNAHQYLKLLLDNGVNIDPRNQALTELQSLIDEGPNAANLQKRIEGVRDSDLAPAYQNLGIPVLFHTYQFGVATGGAESWTNGPDNGRHIITDDANGAAGWAAALFADTPQIPLKPPLNAVDIPGDLSTLANQAATWALGDLRYALIYVRGKCQGILDSTPENF